MGCFTPPLIKDALTPSELDISEIEQPAVAIFITSSLKDASYFLRVFFFGETHYKSNLRHFCCPDLLVHLSFLSLSVTNTLPK
jgi:hypothetical protein